MLRKGRAVAIMRPPYSKPPATSPRNPVGSRLLPIDSLITDGTTWLAI